MAKSITQFAITTSEDGYVLQIEDEDGDTTEFGVSFEQLDIIAEAIDEQLNSGEEDELGIAEDDEEEEEEED
jgi:hypothetical protein